MYETGELIISDYKSRMKGRYDMLVLDLFTFTSTKTQVICKEADGKVTYAGTFYDCPYSIMKSALSEFSIVNNKLVIEYFD